MVRLSPPLFCKMRPVPVRPVTVPPIVKGPAPAPGPPPDPEPEPLGRPLQAAKAKEVRNRDTEMKDLKVNFIAINYSFVTPRLGSCGQLLGIRPSPGRYKLSLNTLQGHGWKQNRLNDTQHPPSVS